MSTTPLTPIVGLASIGTAVVLFPVLKRQSESAVLGILAARILETCLIFFGVISLLSIITLRNDVAGHPAADPASLVTTAHSQVAIYNGTFLLSQSLMPVIVDVLLGYLLYRSRLVPRILPSVALFGAPLLLASDMAVFFGALEPVSPITGLPALPIAAFELALGIWLLVKGFNPSSPCSHNRTPTSASRPIPREPARNRQARTRRCPSPPGAEPHACSGGIGGRMGFA